MALEDFIRFAQAVPDPILILHPDGSVAGSNTAARALFGEATRALADLNPDGACLEMLRMMSRSGEPVAGGALLRTVTGETMPFRCDGALVRARTGDEPALVSVRFRPRETSSSRFVELNGKVDALDREIKTRRRAEALIRAQAKALEMTAGGAPLQAILETLILTIEADALRPVRGSILLFDPATRRLRHGAAPHLPKPYIDAIDGIEIGPAVGSCGTAAWRGTPVIVTDIERDPLWASFRETALAHGLRSCWSTPILSSSGTVLGTFAIYRGEPGPPADRELETVRTLSRIASLAIERDAIETQRAALRESERNALAAAETANRIKDEFLATVSHELRTPLMVIIGWATLLRDAPHDDATREGLAVIEASARTQAQIIEDLLDFSRLTADKLRIDPRAVDLGARVAEAVDAVRPAAEAAGVHLSLALEPLPRTILGDPERIRQVVWNLLTNAIKFAPGGRVTVSLHAKTDGATIVVSDDGEGIDPGFLPHLFDRFSQADSSPRRNHGGLGLGLSIVRRLVEMHGGRIDAASAGKRTGATFTVWLPYASEEPAALREAPEVLAERALRGVRLLMVEDDDASRDILCRMLERAGAVVTAASTAADALERYRLERPDVLVSDIAMPAMDGHQLIREVRAVAGARRVPAIALTSYARPADREDALASGFDAYVTKPVEYEHLVAAVRDALRAAEDPRADAATG